MLTYQLVPRTQFISESNVTLNRLQTTTLLIFSRTLYSIRTTVQGNALVGMFSSNWKFVTEHNSKDENISFLNVPVAYDISNQNRACSVLAQLFEDFIPYYSVKGLVLRCGIFESILRSSLSCFYSKNKLLLIFDNYLISTSNLLRMGGSIMFRFLYI